MARGAAHDRQQRSHGRRDRRRGPTDGPVCAGRSGPLLTFHLAGGEGGMGHMLDHFNPEFLPHGRVCSHHPSQKNFAIVWLEGCESEAAGRSIQDLERSGYECLVGILKFMNDIERRRYSETVSLVKPCKQGTIYRNTRIREIVPCLFDLSI